MKVAKPENREIQRCTKDKATIQTNVHAQGVVIEGTCIDIADICGGARKLDAKPKVRLPFESASSAKTSPVIYIYICAHIFQALFENPWVLRTDHITICQNYSFWRTFNNSHCQPDNISCNGNIGPGFCTPNITWQESKVVP